MVIPTKLYLTTFTSDLCQLNSAQGSQNWPFLMSNSCSAIGNSWMACGTSLPAPHTHTLHERLHYILVLHSFKIHSDSLHLKTESSKSSWWWQPRSSCTDGPGFPTYHCEDECYAHECIQLPRLTTEPTLLWRLLGFRSWRSCVFQLRLIHYYEINFVVTCWCAVNIVD